MTLPQQRVFNAESALPDNSYQKKQDIPFVLPEPNSHNEEVVSYLKSRGVDEKINRECIDKKLIYQSAPFAHVFTGYYDNGNKA